MKQYIQNFKKFQPLLEELVARDIKIKYRRSVLGVLWTLLNPLLMMIVFAFGTSMPLSTMLVAISTSYS